MTQLPYQKDNEHWITETENNIYRTINSTNQTNFLEADNTTVN
jgi:hypothetical protein